MRKHKTFEKITYCVNCFKNKATYLLTIVEKNLFKDNIEIKLLCIKCMKEEARYFWL